MNKIRKRELPDKNEFDTRFVNDIREVRKISFNKKKSRGTDPPTGATDSRETPLLTTYDSSRCDFDGS